MKYLLSLLFFCGHGFSYADDEGVAKAMAQAYAQEQVKQQLAEYLNKNPEIVFSNNPKIGTDAMQFIGKMLAVYSFVKADTDRERMYAAAQFFAPDPYTMMAIFAVQLADTVVTMRHQRDLAKMYEEVARIQKETVKIMSKVYISDFNHQRALLARLGATLETLKDLETESTRLLDSANQVRIVFAIDDAIDRLNEDFAFVDEGVDFEKLNLAVGTREGLREIVVEYKKTKGKITETKIALMNVFKATAAAQWLDSVDQFVEPRRETMNLFGICVKAINAYTRDVLRKVKVTVDTGFLNDCQKHFGLNWEI